MDALKVIDHLHQFIFPAAFALLPSAMNTPEAQAMLLSIGLQESALEARRQGAGGPARGFWQFERGGGVTGVLGHPATSEAMAVVCAALCYKPTVAVCYAAIEHNDVLACCFARLLLWTLSGRLPTCDEPERGWKQYLNAWRPGKPRPAAWPKNYATAWAVVQP